MSSFSVGAMTATKLRIVLLAVVGLLLLSQVGMIFLGQNAVSSYGKQVADAVSLASSNEKTLQDLEKVSAALDAQKSTVEKSKKLIASKDDTYKYQNQIIQDITRYADKSGLKATGFTFTDVTTAKGTPAAAAAPTTPAAGGQTGAAKIPAGVQPVNVTVALSSGASYDSLYSFLQLLEGNTLRMEVDGLNLSGGSSGESGANSAVTTLNIKVYKQK